MCDPIVPSAFDLQWECELTTNSWLPIDRVTSFPYVSDGFPIADNTFKVDEMFFLTPSMLGMSRYTVRECCHVFTAFTHVSAYWDNVFWINIAPQTGVAIIFMTFIRRHTTTWNNSREGKFIFSICLHWLVSNAGKFMHFQSALSILPPRLYLYITGEVRIAYYHM